MKPQDDISINPGATYPNLNNLDGSPFFAWRQYKHADEICPCGSHSAVFNGAGIYASGRDSLCEFTVKERNIEFKAVLAYEPKK